MSLSTYSALKTAITDHANDTSITSAVAADLITLCEADLNRRIKTRRKVVRAEATISAEFTDLPTDFDTAIALSIESTDPEINVTFIDPAKAVELKSSTYTSPGRPVHFSIVGDELESIPVPDGSYTGELTYKQKIPALSDGETTNWVLTNHPDAYFYGSLIHAAPYLIDDPRLPVWNQAYERAMAGIDREDSVSAFAGRLNARAKSFG